MFGTAPADSAFLCWRFEALLNIYQFFSYLKNIQNRSLNNPVFQTPD